MSMRFISILCSYILKSKWHQEIKMHKIMKLMNNMSYLTEILSLTLESKLIFMNSTHLPSTLYDAIKQFLKSLHFIQGS